MTAMAGPPRGAMRNRVPRKTNHIARCAAAERAALGPATHSSSIARLAVSFRSTQRVDAQGSSFYSQARAGERAMSLIRGILRHLVQWFVAGVLALLPLIITVAVVVWVAEYVKAIFGRNTMFGQVMRGFGLQFVSNETIAFLIGVLLVLGVIFLVGMGAETGIRKFLHRLVDATLQRIPLVGSIYGTSKQVVAMLDRKDTDALKAMQVVLCYFGQQRGAGFLALLVSPERYRLGSQDFQIVMIPTAPVPIGGALLMVPADVIQPTEVSVEGLMSIYVSMGITAGQFLKVVEQPATA